MVKIEVKLYGKSNGLYRATVGGKEEISEGWIFKSKTKKGKWKSEEDVFDEKSEWTISIEKDHPCIAGMEKELEKEWLEKENKSREEGWIEKNIYELDFYERKPLNYKQEKHICACCHTGHGGNECMEMDGGNCYCKKCFFNRVFWPDNNTIKLKKVVDNKGGKREREREREREQNWGITPKNTRIGGYN